jgi:glucokinase
MRRIRIKGVNDMKEYAFGIDLGGTTAKVGLFTTSGKLLEKWEVSTDTSNNGAHILENLAAAVQQKMQEKGLSADEVEGVGLGVPGPVLDSSIVPIVCANLGGWGNRNVSIELSELLGGIRVLVGNDANVAALGEIWMGAAQGCRSAVMVTLGTGVGGGVIVNGKVIDGAHGAGQRGAHRLKRGHGTVRSIPLAEHPSHGGADGVGEFADLQKARADTEQQPHANDAHHGGDAPDKAVHRLIDGGNGLDHILPHPL